MFATSCGGTDGLAGCSRRGRTAPAPLVSPALFDTRAVRAVRRAALCAAFFEQEEVEQQRVAGLAGAAAAAAAAGDASLGSAGAAALEEEVGEVWCGVVWLNARRVLKENQSTRQFLCLCGEVSDCCARERTAISRYGVPSPNGVVVAVAAGVEAVASSNKYDIFFRLGVSLL